MNKPWYKNNPDAYGMLIQEVEWEFPDLIFEEKEGLGYFSGTYSLGDSQKVYDQYDVRIKIPVDSPCGIPEVWELSNKIPRNIDLHMLPKGQACVLLPEAYWYEYPQGMSFLQFLKGPLKSYLANHSLFRMPGHWEWPNGDWAHDTKGEIQFINSWVRNEPLPTILNYLGAITNEQISLNSLCPCNSGRRIEDCHSLFLNSLQKVVTKAIATNATESFSCTKRRHELIQAFQKAGII